MPYLPPSSQLWKAKQVPVEAPNGSLVTFTLPGGDSYAGENPSVYLNGLLQKYVTFPTNQTLTLEDAPLSGDELFVTYRTS